MSPDGRVELPRQRDRGGERGNDSASSLRLAILMSSSSNPNAISQSCSKKCNQMEILSERGGN